MNDLKVFENSEFGSIRTVTVDGEPWFVAKDVADALGYQNSRDAIKNHVDDEDKGVAKHDTPGGTQEMTIINESGLYSLVLSSKLPSAKKFKRWVTKEVIPSIRKTGSYSAAQQDTDSTRQQIELLDAQTKFYEARTESGRLLLAIAQAVENPAVREKLLLKTFEGITGMKIPQPIERTSPNKLYTAKEVGQILGCTPQRIGSITSSRGLRTKEYMCQAWSEEGRKMGLRQDYYRGCIIPVLQDILKQSK